MAQEAVKVVVIGDQAVGKTCISSRFVDGTFKQDEKSTIGASFATTFLPIDGNNMKIVIWDTAGQEKYRSMVGMYYRGANVALICYDITSQSSFDSLEGWYTDLMKTALPDVSIAIVGNKLDLEYMRVISAAQGSAFAEKHNGLFFEVSAQSGANVMEMFTEAVKKSKTQPPDPQAQKNNDKVNVEKEPPKEPSRRRFCSLF
ncbi:small GTPase RAB, putative [Entamoeba invadens IP1]|uniref:Small GTPase RAB, putative n=1 Tax=Entamoeba invadens IP1 TaxID=370355 RepID=A0A0A1U6N0_ENTIV|nr:small GTPase RAB, putative [Entamoeba invadens IP1]ELP90073.1 small GTPase RAB, putative [Entamoeba invadens IP1]|eukprot:XP_004256844.1 small GTPase RAB, putative [Entamoeba invadens IP1]